MRYGTTPTAINPELLAIHEPGKLTPWFDARNRPYRKGWYELEYRDGLRIKAVWNGRAWTWCNLRLDTTDLMKWRGKWPV